jgi:hypothetical protein
MSEFDIMASAEGAGISDSLTSFVQDHALAVGVALIVVSIACVGLLLWKCKEGLANPTASLKMMKRDDYGTREGMESGSDNAADQSVASGAASAGADPECAAALADKSTDVGAWAWMDTQLHADNSQEPMASRPKSDNDFSKILVGQ